MSSNNPSILSKYKVDAESDVPLHKQVEKILRKMIENPDYHNGNLFPKEVDLSIELGVARNTVRQAIFKLVKDGLLIRKKGVGTILSPNKIYTRLENWFSFTKEMEAKGLKVVNHKTEVSTEKASADLASTFHIKPGAEVVKLIRLRGTKEKPYLLSVSWFHPRVKVRQDQDFSKPLYQMLEEDNEVFVSVSREDISALAASEDLARELGINAGDPVLYRKRSVYNSDGLVIEYNKVYYRGDGISYAFEISR
ncbi:MAG: GntR family transcriptional regulator [Saprospiraceae bacterium]|nr:GntR family transcriptional regulator [Saprospiraceae bacterium]